MVAALLLWGAPVRGETSLEVSGSVEPAESGLEVRVGVTNPGPEAVGGVSVEGELLGHTAKASVGRGIVSGETRHVRLGFPVEVPRPGSHLVALLLDYTRPGGARMSQRAYLLLAFGEHLPPAVRLQVPEATVDFHGDLPIGIESADGASHRVKLRVLLTRSLRADVPPAPIDVPASGRAVVSVRLFRGDAPRGTRQGILVAAAPVDSAVERTTVAAGLVHVGPDRAWMPRLRWPLTALAVLLLAASGWAEWRRARP